MIYLRYGFLALILLLAVMIALANRAPVTLSLWPDSVTAILGFGLAITLPLFVVVSLALGLGLILGLAWEWLRERSIRSEATRLRRENAALRSQAPAGTVSAGAGGAAAPRQDEILALVDGRKPAA